VNYDEKWNPKKGTTAKEKKQSLLTIKHSVLSVTNRFGTELSIVCDTGANIGIYGNKNLLYNIRPAVECISVEGITDNGVLDVNLIGISKLTDATVYYHKNALANVECLYDINELSNNLHVPNK
jgi:hypothetical protein